MYAITSPIPQFFDLSGDPLDAGKIYIGTAGANPITTPVAVYWDEAGTQPAQQPIRTVSGYPARNGKPARVYVGTDDFSMTVMTRADVVVTTELSILASATLREDLGNDSDPAKGAALIGYKGRTVADKLSESVCVLDFGAVADGGFTPGGAASGTDNYAAFVEALAYCAETGKSLYAPGLYRLSQGITIPRCVHLFGDGKVWAASILSGAPNRGSALLINGAPGADCVALEENAGQSCVESISIYHTSTNAIRAIVSVVGHIRAPMRNVEISSLRKTSGVGLLLKPSVVGAGYETLWCDFYSVEVVSGAFDTPTENSVSVGLRIQSVGMNKVCNTNSFFGGDFAGRNKGLVIDSDSVAGIGLSNTFHGCRFEANYDAAVAPTFVAGSERIYGYVLDDVYTYPVVTIDKASSTAFFGCYFEAAGAPASYNDGVNGPHPVIATVSTLPDALNTRFVGSAMLGCYLQDNGAFTYCDPVHSGGGKLDNAQATAATVRVTGPQSIPTSTFTKVQFGAVVLGNTGYLKWDAANNRYVCRSAGTYLVTAQVSMAGWTTAGSLFYIRVVSTPLTWNGSTQGQQGGPGMASQACCLVSLSAGDTVHVEAYHTQGGSQNTDAVAASNYFSLAKLG